MSGRRDQPSSWIRNNINNALNFCGEEELSWKYVIGGECGSRDH